MPLTMRLFPKYSWVELSLLAVMGATVVMVPPSLCCSQVLHAQSLLRVGLKRERVSPRLSRKWKAAFGCQ